MNNNLKGFAYGIATSVTFGLILCLHCLMEKGMRFDSILFYRFLFGHRLIGYASSKRNLSEQRCETYRY